MSSNDDKEPEDYRAARLAARAATYTNRVNHLRAELGHRHAETEPTEEPA